MGILFPLLNFTVLFIILKQLFPLPKFDWRHSFILAGIGWGVLAVLALEILSPFAMVTWGGLSGFWLLTLCLLIYWAKRSAVKFELPPISIRSLSGWEIGLICGISFIILIIGFIALKAPPNNYDSMTYHMSRVAHWAQNKTIAPYPTNILRQDNYTPWAEYAILHLQVLSDSDRFANCVQWFSMVASVIGTSLIAQQLGAGTLGQILASIFTVTLPMGILQASSTQTDQVTGVWLVCIVYTGLLLLKQRQWHYAVLVGISLGLAALTKGTSYFFSIPFVLFTLIGSAKTYRSKMIKIIAVIALMPLLINAGFYARNLQLQKNLLSKEEHTEISNQSMNPALLTSNIVKNLSLHWGTPFDSVNKMTEKTIYALHAALGISTSDARISWDPDGELHVGEMSSHEDNAGNLLHFIINFICMCFLFVQACRRPRSITTTFWYLLALLTGFILFNAYMKWAPWHSRYHLPLFVLWAPLSAVILSQIGNKKVVIAIGLIFILAAMPWVWGNKSRAFFKKKNIFNTPRIEQYFYNKPGLSFSYQSAVKEALSASCRDIGLVTSPDAWEYPYWPILKQQHLPSFRIEHVAVTNISKDVPYPLGPFDPCVILEHRGDVSKIMFNGKTYVRVREFAYTNVFLEDKDGTLAPRSLIFNFNRFLSEAQKLNAFIVQHPLPSLTAQEWQFFVEMLQTERNNSGHLDSAELNKIYPQLGDHIKTDFARGIGDILQGLSAQDQNKINQGYRSISAWNAWLGSHADELKNALERFQSQIKY